MSEQQTHEIQPLEEHGPLENVLPDIWVVQGATTMRLAVSLRISKTMTVIRNKENGELVLINAMRVSEDLLKEIEALGPIKHVITVGGFHGKDDGFYRKRYGARVYVPEGYVYSRTIAGLDDPENGYMKADVYLTPDAPSQLPLPNAELKLFSTKPPEAVLYIKSNGGILVTADAFHNTPKPNGYINFFGKVAMKLGGFFKPYNIGPGWLNKIKPKAEELQSILLDTEYENVLPGHGDPVVGNAREKYRPSVEAGIQKMRAQK